MTNKQVRRVLQAVRDASETLLAHFDRPQLDDPNGCTILVGQWVKDGKYRSLIHRHDGSFVAADESDRKYICAGTIPLLADALMNWPEGAQPLPPKTCVKIR